MTRTSSSVRSTLAIRRTPEGALAVACAVALLLAGIGCAPSVPPEVPAARRDRYRVLLRAIDDRRSLDPHCWCFAYMGGLCGSHARRHLGLSPADIPLLAHMGQDDDAQVVFGVADLLATIGEPARSTLLAILLREDQVGSLLRIGVHPGRDDLGRYEYCDGSDP